MGALAPLTKGRNTWSWAGVHLLVLLFVGGCIIVEAGDANNAYLTGFCYCDLDNHLQDVRTAVLKGEEPPTKPADTPQTTSASVPNPGNSETSGSNTDSTAGDSTAGDSTAGDSTTGDSTANETGENSDTGSSSSSGTDSNGEDSSGTASDSSSGSTDSTTASSDTDADSAPSSQTDTDTTSSSQTDATEAAADSVTTAASASDSNDTTESGGNATGNSNNGDNSDDTDATTTSDSSSDTVTTEPASESSDNTTSTDDPVSGGSSGNGNAGNGNGNSNDDNSDDPASVTTEANGGRGGDPNDDGSSATTDASADSATTNSNRTENATGEDTTTAAASPNRRKRDVEDYDEEAMGEVEALLEPPLKAFDGTRVQRDVDDDDDLAIVEMESLMEAPSETYYGPRVKRAAAVSALANQKDPIYSLISNQVEYSGLKSASDSGVTYDKNGNVKNCSCEPGSFVELKLCLLNLPYEKDLADEKSKKHQEVSNNLLYPLTGILYKGLVYEGGEKLFRRVSIMGYEKYEDDKTTIILEVYLTRRVYLAEYQVKNAIEPSIRQKTIGPYTTDHELCLSTVDKTPKIPEVKSPLLVLKWLCLPLAAGVIVLLAVCTCVGKKDAYYVRMW